VRGRLIEHVARAKQNAILAAVALAGGDVAMALWRRSSLY